VKGRVGGLAVLVNEPGLSRWEVVVRRQSMSIQKNRSCGEGQVSGASSDVSCDGAEEAIDTACKTDPTSRSTRDQTSFRPQWEPTRATTRAKRSQLRARPTRSTLTLLTSYALDTPNPPRRLENSCPTRADEESERESSCRPPPRRCRPRRRWGRRWCRCPWTRR
jgi:hypothetical protein